MLNSLKQEPAIVLSALKGSVSLPKNYWRFQLARQLWRGSWEDLPAPLRRSFCPLFWVTNVLLLTLPIWWPIAKLIAIIPAKLETLLDAYTNFQAGRSATKLERRNANKLRHVTWDPLYPDYHRLVQSANWIIGEDFDAGTDAWLDNLRQVLSAKLHTLGSLPEIGNTLTHHGLRPRYFFSFLSQQSPTTTADDVINLLRPYVDKICQSHQRSRRREASWTAAKAKSAEKLVTAFGYAKPVFAAMTLMILAPAAYFAALLTYKVVITAFVPVTLFFCELLFTTPALLIFLLAVAAVFAIAVTIHWIDESAIFSRMGDTLFRILEKCALPFKIVVGLICFAGDVVALFFSENCPRITVEEPAD